MGVRIRGHYTWAERWAFGTEAPKARRRWAERQGFGAEAPKPWRKSSLRAALGDLHMLRMFEAKDMFCLFES